jgi:hypothetical protein
VVVALAHSWIDRSPDRAETAYLATGHPSAFRQPKILAELDVQFCHLVRETKIPSSAKQAASMIELLSAPADNRQEA